MDRNTSRAESDPGFLNAESTVASEQWTKKRPFRRFRKSSRSESKKEMAEVSPVMSDAESPTASNGEPPPPHVKHKHRLKLWDSFLNKTRKIRIRSKDKLEKRSTSHPNIPISGQAIPDRFTQTNSLPNGNDISMALDADITSTKRVTYRRQRDTARTLSASSLNDSVYYDPSSPTVEAPASQGQFRYQETFEDDGYRSSQDHSIVVESGRNRVSKAILVRQDTVTTSTGQQSSMDNDADKENDFKEDNEHEEEDDVPVIEQTTPEVSKSVDSLLAVASSVTLPPDATLRSNIRPERHSLQQPFSNSASIGGAASSAQIRRHSYDHTLNDKNDESPEFFDCLDGASDGDLTSSSQEPSPNQRFRESSRMERLVKRQSTLSSLGMSASMASDKDSADSDIDERSSNVLDMEGPIYMGSEDEYSSFAGSPAITVHTSFGEEPSLISVGQHLPLQHSFFMLNVHLREGRDLVIRDSCGTSDPYVKFKYGGKQVHKSRIIYKNLNPRWDEQFTIPIDDITKPVIIKVFDYDRAWNDDPMGGVDLDLTTLQLNKETELKLLLSERGKEEYMGYLLMTCTLEPKSDEDREQFFRRPPRSTDSAKKMKMQLWNGVVNIVLVEGNNLVSMDDNGLSDPYVKFRLGLEKYRSKFKSKTLNPRWLEQFDLRLFDDQTAQLEITVYDHDTRGKDDFMGRAVIDVSQLEKEKTHVIDQELEDGAGTIKLLLTVSGTYGSEMASDLANYTPNPLDKDNIVSKYGLLNSLTSLGDVGQLEVKVFRAHGLQAADFGGLSDPFCVLELINDRVQTQTEYKTLNPEWAKVFTFPVKDIHSVLEVTVYDEDRNKKVEFLGKVAIPLLKIRNGERRWYALKDRKMIHKTKGAILLEMDLVFNHVKAAVRTVNPMEEKLMLPEQKFKISIMKRNLNRVSQLIGVFIDGGRFIQSCFDWQSPPRTITAFIVYLVIVWNFELYMLPISLLLIFLKNLVVAQIVGGMKREPVEDDYFPDEEDEDDEDKEKQEEKKSIVDRYHAVQEVCLQVQQGLDTVACLGERVKNTFNWSVPWLSTLAVLALVAGSLVLFYIPLRYLLLAWGINKFTKKLRKPNAISNNELLDFLSRVPSDNELLQYRELRPDIPANTTSTKKKRS